MDISELVKDWGGFEKFVADLNETGDVQVEHDATIIGRSGAPRQIDVLIRHNQGLYEHLIIAECKFWNTSIERLHVDALSTAVREIGASKGVIFSTKGFQSGAITQAKHDGIDLFRVREITDEEWGQPGRMFDMFLQVNSISLSPLKMWFAHPVGSSGKDPTLALRLGDDTRSNTPIHWQDKPDKTLEEMIERVARESAIKIWPSTRFRFEDGFEGATGCRAHINIEPAIPISLLGPENILIVKAQFDIGIKSLQSRIQIDRSQGYLFAVAIEDCVRNTVKGASRRANDPVTTLDELGQRAPDLPDAEVYKNGSLTTMWTKGFQSFDEFVDVEPGRIVVLNEAAKASA